MHWNNWEYIAYLLKWQKNLDNNICLTKYRFSKIWIFHISETPFDLWNLSKRNKALNDREMHQELTKYLNCGKLCISTGADLYFVRHACMFLRIPKKLWSWGIGWLFGITWLTNLEYMWLSIYPSWVWKTQNI